MRNETTVGAGEAGQRLDLFLASHFPQLTRSGWQKLIGEGKVQINGQDSKSSQELREHQVVTTEFNEAPSFLVPEANPIPILYEDPWLVIIDKPSGMVVHPQDTREQGSLVQALLYQYPELKEAVYDPEIRISRLRPGIVHRLDRDTTGVLVVARTREALLNLANQFRTHTVRKEYLALVDGRVGERATLHTELGRRQRSKRNLMDIQPLGGGGREAITHLEPVANLRWRDEPENLTLLGCQIETGRTHQIRVHCRSIGHPVLGDQYYGNRHSLRLSSQMGISRQQLHAFSLSLDHPNSGERLTFRARLPLDMRTVLGVSQGF